MSVLLFSLFTGFFIGLALSIDAFIFSLVYGMTIRRKKDALLCSIMVGAFHFIMALSGYLFTGLILKHIFSITLFKKHNKHMSHLIFLILGLMMTLKKEEPKNKIKRQSIISILLFAFSVSIDGFFVGIALRTNPNISILIVCFIFFLLSFLVTAFAIRLGYFFKKKLSFNYLNIIAGIIFILFALLSYFFNSLL